jgi:hypothetical protein
MEKYKDMAELKGVILWIGSLQSRCYLQILET